MTIAELKQCRTAKRRTEDLDERIERLRSAAESTTQALRFARGGGTSDKMLLQVAELIELVEKRNAELIGIEELRSRVDEWLDTLPEQHAMILRLRYVDGLSWTLIARKTHYSKSHCFRIHALALKKAKHESQ